MTNSGVKILDLRPRLQQQRRSRLYKKLSAMAVSTASVVTLGIVPFGLHSSTSSADRSKPKSVEDKVNEFRAAHRDIVCTDAARGVTYTVSPRPSGDYARWLFNSGCDLK